jgi:hypothetical protein
MFGDPNEGVHSIRFLNLAVVDVLSTLVVALLISLIFKFDVLQTLLSILTCFVLGIIAHRLFCVDTALNVAMFGRLGE